MKSVLNREPLEKTYSIEEVMEHLGCGETKLHELLQYGRKFRGCHPTKGGLFPTFKVSHRSRRICASAIERHKAHMTKLELDEMFAAAMKAKARTLGLTKAA